MRIGVWSAVILFSLPVMVAQAQVYRWVDAEGHVIYGDNPPKKSNAQPMNLPSLTVADGYVTPKAEPAAKPGDTKPASNMAVPTDANAPNNAANPVNPAATANNASVPQPTPDEPPPVYKEFKVAAPTADSTVPLIEGKLLTSIALTPELKNGDTITIYIDAKQVANGSTQSFNLPNVIEGNHSMFAVLSDAKGNIIQNTQTVKFTVSGVNSAVLTPPTLPSANHSSATPFSPSLPMMGGPTKL